MRLQSRRDSLTYTSSLEIDFTSFICFRSETSRFHDGSREQRASFVQITLEQFYVGGRRRSVPTEQCLNDELSRLFQRLYMLRATTVHGGSRVSVGDDKTKSAQRTAARVNCTARTAVAANICARSSHRGRFTKSSNYETRRRSSAEVRLRRMQTTHGVRLRRTARRLACTATTEWTRSSST